MKTVLVFAIIGVSNTLSHGRYATNKTLIL